jgi:hypothetical protein
MANITEIHKKQNFRFFKTFNPNENSLCKKMCGYECLKYLDINIDKDYYKKNNLQNLDNFLQYVKNNNIPINIFGNFIKVKKSIQEEEYLPGTIGMSEFYFYLLKDEDIDIKTYYTNPNAEYSIIIDKLSNHYEIAYKIPLLLNILVRKNENLDMLVVVIKKNEDKITLKTIFGNDVGDYYSYRNQYIFMLKQYDYIPNDFKLKSIELPIIKFDELSNKNYKRTECCTKCSCEYNLSIQQDDCIVNTEKNTFFINCVHCKEHIMSVESFNKLIINMEKPIITKKKLEILR